MSKVDRLCMRLGDCSARRTDLRFRIAESMRYAFVGSTIVKWVNEIAEISEKIGALKAAIETEMANVSENDRAAVAFDGMREFDFGEPVDLRMASGGYDPSTLAGQLCVECGKGRDLDANGRCSECAMCVAGAGA
jgi:hypothetical protein